jgi:glutamyl-tRNA synthetase
MKIRTRIAPSPTGDPHIGTAYIALFNYAFAKSQGGDFILRIEDTDRTRSTKESEQAIFDALHWVGINWDEGPDVGGDKGPYRQSERFEIYKEYCQKLLDNGTAYYCFCTSERLTELRKKQEAEKSDVLGYDSLCATLSKEEVEENLAAGMPYVIRLKTPKDGDCKFNDRLRGEISIPWKTIDDQVLLKTDGFPTYHLANIVDDHLMEITHVLRGEEWINSAPKHFMLYQAFGWEAPEIIHFPLLRNPDRSKLSKRKNPTSILYYKQAGFLPEAVLNFLGLLSYSMPDESEDFSLQQMVDVFDIDRVSAGGPIFDIQKLRNFNARYIRKLSVEELWQRLKEWFINDDTFLEVTEMAQPRLNQLTDFMPLATQVFQDKLSYNSEAITSTVEEDEQAPKLLRTLQWEIEKKSKWNKDAVGEVFGIIAEKEDMKIKKLMPLCYTVFSGSTVALPLYDSMVLIGKDLCLRRIQYALETLEQAEITLKGKPLKRFTKDYQWKYKDSC